MNQLPQPPSPPPENPAHPGPVVSPCVSFESLAHGEREVHIQHNGQTYRLRLTRNDKLILSK